MDFRFVFIFVLFLLINGKESKKTKNENEMDLIQALTLKIEKQDFLGPFDDISEEELLGIRIDGASLTWRTRTPLSSEILVAECDSSTLQIQKKRSEMEPNSLEQINSRPNAFFQKTQSNPKAFKIYSPLQKNESIYHFMKIDGLKSGVTYCYQVKSGEFIGNPTRWSPGYFTTLIPPSGELLYTFATINDMHVGEKVAGLIVIGGIVLTPGFEWDDPNNPYWKFTNEAAVKDINQWAVNFTVVKGDVSSDFKENEYIDCKTILDRLEQPYYIMRGNHDRVQGGVDYYKQIFQLNQTYYSFNYEGFHFVALDSINLDDGHPEFLQDQADWLNQDLTNHQSMKTFVFLHHAVTLEAFIWSLEAEDRERLVSILAKNSQVVGVFSGHSHRAKLTSDQDLEDIIFAETPSSKEYPMGYTIYEVYTGGYIQHFERSICEECLEWNSMTRQEFFRLAPIFQIGTQADRSFVVNFNSKI